MGTQKDLEARIGAVVAAAVTSGAFCPGVAVLVCCAVRPALARRARGVAQAAQTDLGDVARQLPMHGSLRIDGVPLEGRSTALELERFEAFTPDAQIVIGGDRDDVVLPAPDNAYYRGAVEG